MAATETERTLSTGYDLGCGLHVRRMGPLDLFALLRIIETVLGEGSVQVRTRITGMALWNLEEHLPYVLAMGASHCQDEVIKLCAGVVGMSPEEFSDPDKMPLPAFGEILECMAQHMDVRDFFSRLQGIEGFQRMLQAPPGSEDNGRTGSPEPTT